MKTYTIRWMLFFLAVGMMACQQSTNTMESEVPSIEVGETEELGEPTPKTPSLPATFVDTSRKTYRWNDHYHLVQTLENRIPVPEGFSRVSVQEGSFGKWLRQLPLKPGRPQVMLYNGQPKGNQSAHHLVVDIDVGDKDLQQCADAVMRLRAEYLLAQERFGEISFNFTSGHASTWNDWREGKRPVISGNKVSFVKKASPSDSYENFRAYMNMVFNYAGTASLEKEMKAKPLSEMAIGDVFIQGGFPGHAVIVVDMAENTATGEQLFLLAQSYMPAQEIHILRNPMDSGLNPWYTTDFAGELATPEWGFSDADLKGFR